MKIINEEELEKADIYNIDFKSSLALLFYRNILGNRLLEAISNKLCENLQKDDYV